MDLNKIKERLNTLKSTDQSTGNSGYKLIFRPTAEPKTIRIVPYAWCKENPFQELYLYYELKKNQSLVSPLTIGKPELDPVIDYADELMHSGDTELWKRGKKLKPQLRVFVPVIVRGEESEGIKFWGFGKEIYKKLMELFVDPELNEDGEITDIENGRDIVVQVDHSSGNTYGSPTFTLKFKPKKITDDPKILKKILTEQPKLIGDVFKIATSEELSKALDKFLNPPTEDSTSVENSKPSSGKPSNKAEIAEDDEMNVEDILKEFDDMQ